MISRVCLTFLLTLIVNACAFQIQSNNNVWLSQPRRHVFLRHAYSNTVEPPPMSEADNRSKKRFEQRMREISRRQKQIDQNDASGVPSKRRNPMRTKRPSFLHEVTSLMDYKLQVADEKERISVVRFYSPYCRSCKAARPAFDQLANKFPELNWVEVPVTKANTALHQGLGVPSVPFGHIYIPGAGLVEELRMVRPQMKRFGQILNSYVEGQCSLPPDVDCETGVFEAPY